MRWYKGRIWLVSSSGSKKTSPTDIYRKFRCLLKRVRKKFLPSIGGCLHVPQMSFKQYRIGHPTNVTKCGKTTHVHFGVIPLPVGLEGGGRGRSHAPYTTEKEVFPSLRTGAVLVVLIEKGRRVLLSFLVLYKVHSYTIHNCIPPAAGFWTSFYTCFLARRQKQWPISCHVHPCPLLFWSAHSFTYERTPLGRTHIHTHTRADADANSIMSPEI